MARRRNRRQLAQQTLIRCLREGISLPVALRVAGVPKATYYDWLKRYPKFREQVEQAEANAIAHLERVAFSLAIDSEDWRAISWLLERRFPEVYNPKHQSAAEDYTVELEVAPDDGGSSYKVQLRQPTNGTKP